MVGVLNLVLWFLNEKKQMNLKDRWWMMTSYFNILLSPDYPELHIYG